MGLTWVVRLGRKEPSFSISSTVVAGSRDGKPPASGLPLRNRQLCCVRSRKCTKKSDSGENLAAITANFSREPDFLLPKAPALCLPTATASGDRGAGPVRAEAGPGLEGPVAWTW